ncbi:MAG: LysR family transcriptional regulator [Pseudobacteriovorax sp.]|nr:LysR family transcriptional regulator [Pseudobacteriovorax sp.]
MQVDPKKIAIFLEVAKEGSVTKAAEKLFRTQSAVTHQIRSLETELGVELFDRQHRKIVLTKEGQRLKKQAEPIIHQLSDLCSQFLESNEAVQETIRVGLRQDIHSIVIPKVFEPFTEAYPNVRVEFVSSDDATLESMLGDHQIDFAFIVVFRDKQRFHSKSSFSYTERVYCRRNCETDVKTNEDLADGKLIDFSPGFQCFKSYFQKFQPGLVKALDQKKPRYTAPNHSVVVELLKGSDSFGLLPDFFASNHDDVRPLLADQRMNVRVDLAWNKSDYLRQFEQDLVSMAEKLELR